VVMGVIAGYFGGWVDAVIARAMDVFLAFPLLVFAIALVGVIPSSAFGLSGNSLRIGLLVFVIGFFAWPYMGRIIRGQTLSLREREFVDAARSLGARGPYILFRELLPNLVAPILVYATLLIPTNILFEAALDYLGVGLYVPTPTWGQMLASAAPPGSTIESVSFRIGPGSVGGLPNIVATAVGNFKIKAGGKSGEGNLTVAFINGPLIEANVPAFSTGAPVPTSLMGSLAAAVAGGAAQP